MAIINRERLQDRIKERYDTLVEESEQLMGHELLAPSGVAEVYIDDVQLYRAIEAYFLVSEAYKIEFKIEATEPPKVAAITALMLGAFTPLRLVNPYTSKNEYSLFANEILSLSWAARPLGQDFGDLIERRLRKAGLLRYFRTLQSLSLPCLHEYRADVYRSPPSVKDEYDIRLNYDTALGPSSLSSLPAIELMVLLFEFIWDGNGRLQD